MKKKRTQPIKTLVDVVIPVYGQFELLSLCLERLKIAMDAHSIKHNVILVDNHSPDIPHRFYDSLSDITLVRNKENLGYPKACNIGARRKQSPLIFFLNSDVLLESDSVERLIRKMDDPNTAIVGMKLLFPDDAGKYGLTQNQQIRPSKTVQHVGIATNIRGDFVHIFLGWSADHPKVNQMYEVYAVTGAAMMVRRSVWNMLGGFDENYGMGTYEDVDLCIHARARGYNVIVDIDAVGTHYVGATSEKYKIWYPQQVNKMYLLQKLAKEQIQVAYTELEHL